MKNFKAKNGKTKNGWMLVVPLLILFSINATAHDSGISSVSIKVSGGELIIYSSYSGADFAKVRSFEDSTLIESLAEKAFLLETDGKVLKPKKIEVISNNSHELVFEHIYENTSGKEINFKSLLPPSLSPNHTQILTIVNNEKNEILHQNLVGNYQITFDLDELNTSNESIYTVIILISIFGIFWLIKSNFLEQEGEN